MLPEAGTVRLDGPVILSTGDTPEKNCKKVKQELGFERQKAAHQTLRREEEGRSQRALKKERNLEAKAWAGLNLMGGMP